MIGHEFDEEEEGHDCNNDVNDNGDDDDDDNGDGGDDNDVSNERLNNIAPNYGDTSNCDIRISHALDKSEI
ncbi:hypothetical protein LOAG_16818 [Loa loa]|nr:hypothetical protein LOAG_16818 [Loa loa]EJD76183.1 hypothetical protein LOAG_16818 [Loa loa]